MCLRQQSAGIGGRLPPMGEGWGEGLRSIDRAPHPAPLPGRGAHRPCCTTQIHKSEEPRTVESSQMQIGVVGLGRMGANIVRRLTRGQHRCVAFDADAAVVRQLAAKARPAPTASPIWWPSSKPRARSGSCCRPARSPTRPSRRLARCCRPDDTVIDGGNTFYQDDVRAGGRAPQTRYPSPRRRHQRRGVGARARLLPDDRRRARRGRAARSHLCDACARRRRHRPARPTRDAATAAPSAAISIAARTAPGTS